jgi:ATP-dependent DNA helicase RecG
VIGRGRQMALRDIMSGLSSPPAAGTVRDDPYHLKRLGLIDSKGYGRGAVWFLVPGERE